MNSKIYWLSEDEMSPSQQFAIRQLHGVDVEIVRQSPALFTGRALEDYVSHYSSQGDSFVYLRLEPHHLLRVAFAGLQFWLFENYRHKRGDGTEALAAVHHVKDCRMKKVWVNPEQTGDRHGMSLLGAFPGYK